jgi:hypothetical protein
MVYRKSYEVVGWSYNAALYCVSCEPNPDPSDIEQPQVVVLDQVTHYDSCDVCFLPLDA